MNYDDFRELKLFAEGPAAIAAASMVKLRSDLVESFPMDYQDALAASLEYITAHLIQLCELDGVQWGKVFERAEARARLETFFDEENI